MDEYAIECVYCGWARGPYELNLPAAKTSWNEWALEQETKNPVNGQEFP